MKKHLKLFIFTALACTFLLRADVSAQAASKSSNVAINDTNFSEELMIYAKDADKNQDGYLSAKEADTVTRIALESNKNTDIFKGIQYFTELETFKFDSYIDRRDPEEIGEEEKNTVQKLNLSGMEKLEKVTVDCGNPYLKEISLENCSSLKEAGIDGGFSDYSIHSLNLKGCTNLQKLNCVCIAPKKINLSGFKKLSEVSLFGIKSTTVNLKRCSNLKRLDITSKVLSNLKLKGTDKLENMYIWADSLQSLDLSTNTKLSKLICDLGIYTFLDLSKNINLRTLNCNNSDNLKELNVSGCKKLKAIRCNNTSIKKINVKKNTNLQVLLCKDSKMKKLNLKKSRNLKTLDCKNTNIRELDLSKTKIKDASSLKCDPDVTVTYAK